MDTRKILAASIAIAALSALVIPNAASSANDGDTVYMYCIGNPPSSVRASHAYVSGIFPHLLDVLSRSVDRSTSEFREFVLAEYGQTIGATCHHFDSWNGAEKERDATILHRRNNGYSIDYVD